MSNNIVYVALWSLPGCLPEMEPARFEDFTDAKQFICDEIERVMEQCYAGDRDDEARQWHKMLNYVRGHITDAPFGIPAPDGYIYEITTDAE